MDGALAERADWTNVGPHLLAAQGSLTRLEDATEVGEGAVSTRGINSTNGYLEFRASDQGIVGLSNGDTDGLEDDIDFGLEFWYGSLFVVENGDGKGQFGTVTPSDVLRISVESGVVVYRKNGAMIYTSTIPPQYPLVVDTSFDSLGGSASSVALSGVLVDVATSEVQLNPSGGTYASAQTVTVSTATSGATIYYTLDGSQPTTSSPVVSNGGTVPLTSSGWLRAWAHSAGRWPSSIRSEFYAFGDAVSTELVGWTNVGPHLLAAPGSLTRLEDSTDIWEGAVSTRGINSPNGYLEFRASDQGIVGLSNGDNNGLEDDIDFGLEFWYDDLFVVENGEGRGQFGTVTSSDVLRVSVENGVVVYRKNGAVIYTSTIPPQYPLVVDTSLDSLGASVWSVALSGVLADVATSGVQLNPSGGTYASAQTVTVSTATSGATIYYTLDGSEPTTSSPLVSNGGTVPLTSSGWLRVRAHSAGRWPSATRSDFYALGNAVTTELADWTNVGPHVSAALGSLTRPPDATGLWEGAVSTRGINSPDGYLEFRASDQGIVGLSNGDTNGLEDDIDFGLKSWYDDLFVVENGEGRGQFGSVTPSDVLRVSVENGVVVYRKNGAVIYTSTTPPHYPLVADTSFDSSGASAVSVMLSGVLVDSRPPSPAFAPPAGTYQAAINVVMSAAPGTVIRYTTNGVDPTSSSPVYSSAIPLAVSSAITTIKAFAALPGYVPSVIASASYNFGPATPTFAPPAGTYNANQTVAISTATAGATIRYTTNGTTPTGSSTLYSTPVSITQTTTLKAKAFLSGLPDSLTGPAIYTLAPIAPALTPNGAVFVGSQSVTMTTSTSGSSIRYTTDGSTPTATSTLYSTAINVTTPTTIKAAAFKTGWAMSAVTTATFTPTVATPTFSPVAATYTANQTVTIATTTTGDTIRYTLDGTDPTAASTLYTGPVSITQTTTLKAKGFLTNWADSVTGTALYTLNATAPTFNPNGGALTAGQTITLTTTTGGASIRYTTDGTAPTGASTLYSAPFALGGPATVKAATFKTGWTTSGVASAAFTTTVTTPTFSPLAGTYPADQTVTISTTAGAEIRYTTNGTTPTASSTLYTGPVAVTQTTTLKAIGILSGWTNSLVGTAAYTMAASAPTFTPSSGNLPSGQGIAMATATVGGSIRYTTNGTTPTGSSTLYTAPIAISAPITLKAATFKTGWTTSGVTTAAFTPSVATPTFSPIEGTYNANQTVAISTTTSGDTIRYTLDGSDPTTGSAVYSAPLSITATTTLKAKGFLASWANSATGTAIYTITGAPPTFTPNGGTFMGSQSVTMTTTTSGASIRYTTDGTTPTPTSTLYSTAIVITTPTTINAATFKAGWSQSATTTAVFTPIVATPAITPAPGLYANSVSVSLNSTTAGAQIHYTIDGSTPTGSSPLYSGPVTLTQSATVKAVGMKPGFFDSAVNSAAYTVAMPWAVEWTNQVNVASIGPGVLSKVGGADGFNAGGISTRAIASGDGYVEARWSILSNLYLGLSSGDTNQDPSDIDYAVQATAGGLLISEGGTVRGTFGGPGLVDDLIRIAVEGGVVRYYKNGSMVYSSLVTPQYPLLVDTSFYTEGFTLSNVMLTGALTSVGVSGVAAAPPAGSYGTAQSVSLSTATPGASIYYTVDGAEPTVSSALYSAPVLVSGTGWLKAKAFASGLFASATFDGYYAIGTATNTEAVSWTNLTNASSSGPGVLSYAGGVPALPSGGVSTRAIAGGNGYVEAVWSNLDAGLYLGLSSGDTDQGLADIDYAAQVTAGGVLISEHGQARGAFGGPGAPSDVIRIAVEAGVVKYYKNGSLVYASLVAPQYPLLVDTSLQNAGTGFSAVSISGVLVDSRLAPPQFSPPGGTLDAAADVTLSSVPGATVRFTTTGVDPTASSPVYSAPVHIALEAPTTIKAFAARQGYLPSAVATAAYTFAAATPTINPNGGTFANPVTVTLATTTTATTIRYTLDGSDPSASSTQYAGPFVVGASATLKAKAFHATLSPSATASAAFLVGVPSPTITPTSGTYVTSVNVSIGPTPGASIYYTTDGQDPTTASSLYGGAFALAVSATVKAKAFIVAVGWSATASAGYTIKVADPVLSVASGLYTTRRNVVASTSTPGAAIHYMTNGQDPTGADPSVASGGIILVDRALVLKARALKAGALPSATVRAQYMITGALSFGTNFTLFLKADGTVWSAGLNDKGQLGVGSTTQKIVPTQIAETASFNSIKAVEAGDGFSLFLKEDGTVWVSGAAAVNGTGANVTFPVQITAITVPVVKIAAGKDHAIALDGTGHVWTWGNNGFGQLGNGNKAARTGPCNPAVSPCQPSLGSIVGIAGGAGHTLALLNDGTVRSWGGNTSGELGIGTRNGAGTVTPAESLAPVTVNLPVPAIRVLADNFHSMALTAAGEVWSWGDNERGGGGRAEPFAQVPVPGMALSGQRLIALGFNQGYAASFSGPIWGFGENQYGCLGDGTQTIRPAPGPTLPVPERYAIEGAYLSAGAITMASEVYVWGINGNGQLGLNNTQQIKSTPLRVPDPAIPANPFILVNNAWLLTDEDGDGLTAGQELMSGLDPYTVDTNGDGIGDGVVYALGSTLTLEDPDGDGLPTLVEATLGTNPNSADTDGDGITDNLDVYPLDPSRLVAPTPDPSDHTPPDITLIKPQGAQQVP